MCIFNQILLWIFRMCVNNFVMFVQSRTIWSLKGTIWCIINEIYHGCNKVYNFYIFQALFQGSTYVCRRYLPFPALGPLPALPPPLPFEPPLLLFPPLEPLGPLPAFPPPPPPPLPVTLSILFFMDLMRNSLRFSRSIFTTSSLKKREIVNEWKCYLNALSQEDFGGIQTPLRHSNVNGKLKIWHNINFWKRIFYPRDPASKKTWPATSPSLQKW